MKNLKYFNKTLKAEIDYKLNTVETGYYDTGYNGNSLLTTHFPSSRQNSYLLSAFDFGFSDTGFYDISLLTTPLLHPREQNYLYCDNYS